MTLNPDIDRQIIDKTALAQAFMSKYRVNTNYLETAKFVFVTHSMPHLNLFCQTIEMPGVSTTPAIQPNPLVDIPRSGDKLVFAPLTISFIVDEDLRVWEEVYNWLKGITFPEKFSEYRLQKQKGIYTDANLIFLKNSNTDNFSVRFHNCTPMSLSGIRMTTTEDAKTILTADLQLAYILFKFDRP